MNVGIDIFHNDYETTCVKISEIDDRDSAFVIMAWAETNLNSWDRATLDRIGSNYIVRIFVYNNADVAMIFLKYS